MKVIITGMAGKFRDSFPYDLEAETWGLNTSYLGAKRPHDKLFIMHKQVLHPKTHKKIFNWRQIRKYANKNETELILQFPIKELEPYTLYPMQDVIDYFRTEYFADTFCYMIAYALFTGVKDIVVCNAQFYGEDPDTEDRAGVEYWIGRAHSIGVKLEVREPTGLLRTLTGERYAING